MTGADVDTAGAGDETVGVIVTFLSLLLSGVGADGGWAGFDAVGSGTWSVLPGAAGARIAVGRRRGVGLASSCSAILSRRAASVGSAIPPHSRLRFAQEIDVPDNSMLCR